MCMIAESNVLLRAHPELPAGLKVATEVFADGWKRMRSGGVERLEKKVHVKGWNFIKVAECGLRSGVGDTSEAAIASAIKLALRRMDRDSNAVKVQQIDLTQYPWFFLARVRVHSYRIQQEAERAGLPVPEAAEADPVRRRCKRLPAGGAALFSHFGVAMPALKEMLIAPGDHEAMAMHEG